MKTKAVFVNCTDNEGEHSLMDNCWGCAPHWWRIPLCPRHKMKLATSGFCKVCRKFYSITEQK